MRVHPICERQNEVLPVPVKRRRYDGNATGLDQVEDVMRESSRLEAVLDDLQAHYHRESPVLCGKIVVNRSDMAMRASECNAIFRGVDAYRIVAALSKGSVEGSVTATDLKHASMLRDQRENARPQILTATARRRIEIGVFAHVTI